MKGNTKTLTVRLDADVFEELGYLSNALGLSMNKVVNLLVRQEYNKYQADPKIMEVIDKLQRMRDILAEGTEGQSSLY